MYSSQGLSDYTDFWLQGFLEDRHRMYSKETLSDQFGIDPYYI